MPFPFPCSPVIREWSSKKTQIEKKDSYRRRRRSETLAKYHVLLYGWPLTNVVSH